MKVSNLLALDTIEDNAAFGLLKIETDKEKVYVSESDKKVFVSTLINGIEDSYFDTVDYSFNEWDELN